MIHERVFGSYIIFTLIRLLNSVAFFSLHVFVYLGSLAIVVGGIVITRFHDSIWAWRVRLLIYPVLMSVLFVNLRWVSPIINEGKKDDLLWKLDELIAGGSLSVMMESIISPLLTEFLSFCYIFFLVYLYISIITWLLSSVSLSRMFYVGLFSLYGIGYFGYTLVPAVGPYINYASEFTAPLKGYYMTDFLEAAYPSFTNFSDVFPSLHCAATVYMLLFDMKWNRRRFLVCLIPSLGLVISTIYLRFHYFVDILAGLFIAAAALLITRSVRLSEEL